tara:strand:- start:1351 stop:5121 length:3771 start_codon:yes stop_codon:yes gene_type:complete
MASITGIDKNVEEKVFRLLAAYKEIQSFKDALAHFEEAYDKYGQSILNETAKAGYNNGAGVQNFEQALQLMESSNFIKGKTVYKQIGLILGIDPEYFQEFRLDPKFSLTVTDKLKQLWNKKAYNLTYNNNNIFGGGFPVKQLIISYPEGGAYQTNTIFVLPGVMQYFVNLGVYRARFGADSSAGTPLLELVRTNLIANILEPFVARTLNSRDLAKTRGILENDRIKINELEQSVTTGTFPDLDEYKYALTDEGAYAYIDVRNKTKLAAVFKEIIEGQGTFAALFDQLDTAINNFYDNNHKKLELYKVRTPGEEGGTTDPDIKLRNRQLQDILAFFGDAAKRRDAAGRPVDPEVSIATLEDAPASVRSQYLPVKLTPFDFQCFLLENISKLVDERENGSFKSNYKHVVKVSNNGDPGNIINTIEHGTRNEYIQEFLNICPEVYGLLVPYLKISRIEYDDVGNVKLDGNGRSIEKELKIPNFLTQDDIQNILDSAVGRAPGAGIKSFSWALDGVQPAEVDNNISATLVMYFQSVDDFFNGARRAGQGEPNFLDLIINSPGVRKLKKKTRKQKPDDKPCSDDILNKKFHQDYQGHNFRVKICAGWATPPHDALVQLTNSEDKADKLTKAFDDSRISLFLQMTQHTINFAQNGTLELSVRYQASLAGLLTGKTADIFDVTPKSIEQDIEREENKIEAVSEGEQSDSDKKAKKEALEEIQLLKNIDRNVKYKKLLKRVFGSPETSRVFNISLNPLELTQTPYGELSPEDRQKRVKRKQSETLQFQTIPSLNKDVIDAINKNQGASGKDTGNAYSKIASKRFLDLTNKNKINIPFFFLGDLLDAVIEEIKSNNQKNPQEGVKPLNFHMFASDVEMIDPLQAFKVKNLEDLINCGYDLKQIVFLDAVTKENPTDTPELNGIYKTMNIGDIPISLDAFQLWFKDNVIKKEKNTYFLLYFIKDICNDLITKALSSKCFGKAFNFQQRFDVQPLTLAREEAKNSAFTPNRTYSAKRVGSAQAAVRCELDPAQTELGLLLYPTDSRPKRLLGMKSYDSDIKRGIYHHFLGSACGLVKTINFSRQDQAYLRESRIQKEGALGAEQLRELYSADIDLIGNTLYKNGMYIYINPSLLGASEEYLDYLGLHGYYLVTSVKSTITPSSFDVSIGALHEGIEFKDNKRLPTADVGDLAAVRAEDAPFTIPSKEEEESVVTNPVRGSLTAAAVEKAGDITEDLIGTRNILEAPIDMGKKLLEGARNLVGGGNEE